MSTPTSRGPRNGKVRFPPSVPLSVDQRVCQTCTDLNLQTRYVYTCTKLLRKHMITCHGAASVVSPTTPTRDPFERFRVQHAFSEKDQQMLAASQNNSDLMGFLEETKLYVNVITGCWVSVERNAYVRMAVEFAGLTIGAGQVVSHSSICELNRHSRNEHISCCRPSHLRVASKEENIKDRQRRLRAETQAEVIDLCAKFQSQLSMLLSPPTTAQSSEQ